MCYHREKGDVQFVWHPPPSHELFNMRNSFSYKIDKHRNSRFTKQPQSLKSGHQNKLWPPDLFTNICNNVELPPMVNPLPPSTTLDPFVFHISTISWPIVCLSYHPSLLSNNNNNNKYKWSSGGACFLQMIVRRNQPLANDQMIAKKILFSKYSLPFPSPIFFTSTNNIFSFSKHIPSFPSLFFFSTQKIYFHSLNIFHLFLLCFSSPPQTIFLSFFKYYPPFPSLFSFSSKGPKLKILES